MATAEEIMANQQTINIGSQPNDGTGDSIYTAFQKVNQNFSDVYNLLGFGASFSFLRLKEAPTSLTPKAMLSVNDFGTRIVNRTLNAGTGINILITGDSITIANTASTLKSDTAPTLAGNLNGQNLYSLVNMDRSGPLEDYDAVSRRWVFENFVSRTGYAFTGSTTLYYTSSTVTGNIPSIKDATSSTHLVNKKYADTKIGLAGTSTIDSFTGLPNPAFGTMTGALYLFRDPVETDHPSQAATKNYVDSSSFISPVNFYVSLTGSDTQFDKPVYKRGRGPAYAFKTVNRAARAAEMFIQTSEIVLGPYLKTVTYNNTLNTAYVTASAASTILDATLFGVQLTMGGVGSNGSDGYVAGSIFPGCYIQGKNSGAIAKIESIRQSAGDEIYDVVPVDYAKGFNVPITPDSISGTVTFTLNPSDLTETPDFWIGYKFTVSNNAGTVLSYGTITDVGETIDTSNNCVNYIVVDFSNGVGLTSNLTIEGDNWHVFVADFELAEEIEWGQLQPKNQCTIILESGEHRDEYPIRLGQNVSLRGDEFRRSIVKPQYRDNSRISSISGSKWANTYFFRDTQIDQILTVQLNTSTDYASAVGITINSLTNDSTTRVVTVTLATGSASASWIGKVFKLSGSYKGNGIITAINANTFAVNLAQNSNYLKTIENYTPGATIPSGSWSIYSPINYGYHYLRDASRPINLLTTVYNGGGINNASKLLELNRSFIQSEIIAWINATYPSFSYNQTQYRADVGYIVDAFIDDMRDSGNNNTINIADEYRTLASAQIVASINRINTIGQLIIANSTVTKSPGNSASQVIDSAYTAETRASAVLADLVQACSRIVNSDPAFNPPKYNDQMDVFLMNDATLIRYVSAQGHGGFMKVLDPNGQILAKSPYTQTASSFSKSYNRHVFSGGMFIDGFAGNLQVSPASITNNSSGNPVKINITSPGGLGRPAVSTSTAVRYEIPQTPCFFVHNGVSYEVNFISEWDPLNGTGGINLNPARAGGIATVTSVNGTGFRTGATRTVRARFGSPTKSGGLASTGTATINSSGVVTAIATSFPGSGYVNGTFIKGTTAGTPDIVIGGARLSWTISNAGVITGGTIIDGGEGYAVNTPINFPVQGGGVAATAHVSSVDANGAITGIAIDTGGTNYSSDPSVTFGGSLAYTITVKPGFITTTEQPLPNSLTLITAGNRSMLANDFTQMNDLGYGIFCTNGALVENVSMFTYYCYSAYYALNGAQCRSVAGSCVSGENALRSEGSDPTEVPVSARSKYATSQIATVKSTGAYTNKIDDSTIYVESVSYVPIAQSQLEINHNGVWRLYNVKSATQDSNTSGVYNLSIDDGTGKGLYAAVADGTEVIIRQYFNQVLMDVNASTLSRPSTVLTYNEDPTYVYRILSFTNLGGDSALAEGDTPYNYILFSPYFSGNFYRQGLGKLTVTSGGSGYTPNSTVTAVIPAPTAATRTATVNGNQTDTDLVTITGASGVIHIGTKVTIGGVDPGGIPTYVLWSNSAGTQIRVSNATNWTTGNTLTFTNIQATGYGVTNSSGVITSVVLTESGVGYDSTSVQNITFASGSATATAYVTGIAGTKTIKVADIGVSSQARIASGITYIFGYEGDIYKVTAYRNATATGNAWGEVDFERLSDAAALQAEIGNTTLKAGTQANQVGGVTSKISSMRVTGHDLSNIGTGGYADSKYPNDLYGPPNNAPDSSKEVQEIGKGRVYYVTSDQDGNFKVGKFFSVDQGRGTVSISAPISLTNVDGISFKRGQTLVQVFSVDGTMGNESNNSVPTEKAIVSYVDSRLGLNKNNSSNGVTPIGSGYLDLGGVRSMGADLKMNTYKVTGVGSPTATTDAATKGYADTKLAKDGVNSSLGASAGTLSGPVYTNELRPNTDLTFWLGTSTYRYSDVYAARFQGTATSALKWDTARTVTFSGGDVTGSFSIDGSSSVTNVALTIGADSVALGTDTTGNYVKDGLISGFGVSGSSSSEGGSYNITVNSTSSNTANYIVARDASGNFNAGIITATTFVGDLTGTARDANKVNSSLTLGTHLSWATGSGFDGSAARQINTNATDGNTVSTIVARDASGDFAARTITLESITKAGSDGVGNIGSGGNRFNVIYGTATSAYYADLAEKYLPDAEYEPGTVVVFGGDKEVTIARQFMDRRIAGVVSTNPAYRMNDEQVGGIHIALTGRVPCKVVGKIKKGDMLVSSGAPGVATADNDPKLGSVIGKALEDYDSQSVGVIEVVVGRL